MIVDLDGNKFRVTFEHDVVKRPEDLDFPEVRVTRCYIWKDKPESAPTTSRNGVLVSIGHAVCNPRFDQFVKNKGRKCAMARALQTARFDKGTRTKFWTAYRETRHGKI